MKKKLLVILASICVYMPNLKSQINFQESIIDNNNHGSGSIVCSDLNADGQQDIIQASLQDNKIVWYKNDGGDPIVWTKYNIGTGVYSAHSVYTGDMDNDGDQDVVGAAYSGSPGIAWWKNDGSDPIVWSKYVVDADFINAHEVFVADVNLDGQMDILAVSSDLNTVAWWRNEGGNPILWTKQILSSNAQLAKSVAAADMDGDSDVDIVAASLGDNKITWWENLGGDSISWAEHVINSTFYGAHRVRLVDLDGDSDIDILGAAYYGNQVSWWRNDGGNPVQWTKFVISNGVINACVAYTADIDLDGDLDVIATAQGDNTISWWENTDGIATSWEKHIIVDDFIRPWPLYASDIDNDQDFDIISGSSHNGSNEVKCWYNMLINTNISENENFKASVQLFPNPFISATEIEIKERDQYPLAIQIYNTNGKMVKKMEVTKDQRIVWDGTNKNHMELPDGMYLIKVIYPDKAEVLKTIKHKHF